MLNPDLIAAAKRAGLAVKESPDIPALAEDSSKCPSLKGCRCKPVCKICGYRRHQAIHCGTINNPAKPYGHAFVPKLKQE